MQTRPVTPEEHRRIAAAIRAAEAKTSGEIYCVVARTSDSYFFPAALVVAVSMMIAALGVALVLEAWWISIRLPVFMATVLLALAAALGLLYAMPAFCIRLVPRRWQFARAHDNALKQFLARNVHITAERTGVLVFVSLAERYAAIVADAGINGKVPQQDWDGIVAGLIDHARSDRLTEGFVSAVQAVGDRLAAHFPLRPGDANELDDHLVEI